MPDNVTPSAVLTDAVAASPRPPVHEPTWRDESQVAETRFVDYVRANRHRILWIAADALLLAEAIVGILVIRPQQYSATATVTIPSAGSAPFDVGRSIAEFRSAATSRPVLEKVATQTGVSFDRVKSGVSVSRQGTSRYVKVTYTDTKRVEVPTVARVAAVKGVEALFQPAFDAAEKNLARSQKDLDGIQSEINKFNASHGLVLDPPESLRQRQATLAGLQTQLAQAQSRGSRVRAATLRADIAKTQLEVDALSGVVVDYKRLQANQAQLQAALNSAAAKRGEAGANIGAANSAVDLGGFTKVKTVAKLAVIGVLTFIVGFLLMLGANALWPTLLERRSPSRRAGRRTHAARARGASFGRKAQQRSHRR